MSHQIQITEEAIEHLAVILYEFGRNLRADVEPLPAWKAVEPEVQASIRQSAMQALQQVIPMLQLKAQTTGNLATDILDQAGLLIPYKAKDPHVKK